MDQHPAPHEPVAIYEGPALRFFRGYRLLALIVLCVLAGALLRELLLRVDVKRAVQLAQPPTTDRYRMQATLSGNGSPIVLPLGKPAVVNVWLQNCADCMPTFEAFAAIKDHPALRSHDVINIAYGRADAEFAARYGVQSNLVFDDGSHIVQPLGIGTFTTFIIDGDGHIVLRALARDAGFIDRVDATLRALDAQAEARAHHPPDPHHEDNR